ncbi:chloramphenicol-sensitive protein RarD [Acinetobacter calcoaceticus]|uniref:Chloramphenicol-sensitive protein RarD n=1 Tax=Acinetobacter calcoaceticus TaxID=471 RepID=A0A4R1XZ99_ACICA|nr:chloramphenicol-sensitive protein RarD [Acinetobacter calcoaceticus]
MFKGIVLSIMASITFGVLYFYTQWLGDFNSEQVFGWRIIATIPFLTLFMYYSGELRLVNTIMQRVRQQPLFILMLLLSSGLCALQLWLFLWGPINGRGLQVSLGYFLLPLVLVLSGCVLYKEKLSKFQSVAVACALVGVGHEFWQQGSVAWETMVVAVGYSVYFILRKMIKTDHLGGFWWDMLLCLPVAIYFTQLGAEPYLKFLDQPSLILVIAGLGLLSAIGLGSYLLASRHLPLILFGLLSYLEPVLLAFAALLMGEHISADEWWTYIPIWAAVMILVLEGVWHLYQQQRKSRSLKLNREKIAERLGE